MRILFTGACGRLGKHVRAIAGDEHEFVCMDVDPEVEKIGGICANVTDRDAVFEAARGCDAVMHAAACHAGNQGEPYSTYAEINVIGTENVLAAALDRGAKRVIFSSTLEIMVGRQIAPRFGTAVITEDMPVWPDWNYSVTKAQAELLCQMYWRTHGLETVMLRYGDFCWPDEVRKLSFGLLSICLTPSDAARANLLALERPGLGGQVIHIGPNSPLRQRDVNEAMNDPWAVLERHWPGCRAVLEAEGTTNPPPNRFSKIIAIDKAVAMLGYDPESRFDVYLESIGWQRPDPADAALAQSRG